MASPRPEGAVVLVAGHGAFERAEPGGSAVHILGQIGEALLATSTAWHVRRLSPQAGVGSVPDRATLKHHLDELARLAPRVALVAIAGVISSVSGVPALATSAEYHDYPEDTTLPLAWMRERIAACGAECVLVVLSCAGTPPAPAVLVEYLRELAVERAGHVTAVHASAHGHPALELLRTGLCGEAADPATGTITLRSASQHLARGLPDAAIHGSELSWTLASPPPLGGLWNGRRHELSRTHAMAEARRGVDDDDLSGVVLPGRFRLDRRLASGNFGTVYRARQLTVERDVAVKVLHASIDPGSEGGRLFVQEIQCVGRIDHLNVVRIFQADVTSNGRLFFAMELLQGQDLRQLLGDGCMARAHAIELVRQLLDGLGAAHEAGLVHADVKPANAVLVPARERERLVLLDFGLARLRELAGPSESAGGTPAYMAPEQLRDRRVDARSDLYSAALVLISLLTGWRRRRPGDLQPPLEAIEPAALRSVLIRATALDPADRFQSAAELSEALAGRRVEAAPAPPRAPFHHLAPFSESDRGRLCGRERELAVLVENVLYRRLVIYAAPSGVGKTSILRAGLVPRALGLGARVEYIACREGAEATLAAAIHPGARGLGEAVSRWHGEDGRKLVLIIDQLETLFADEVVARELIDELLALEARLELDIAVVLSVREDFLAQLIATSRRLEQGTLVLRLPPLALEGAREAISGPLAENRMSMAPELLATLLEDLRAAAAAIAPEMGWGRGAVVYPPHLQLVCSALYEALPAGEAALTLAHYRGLGGFEAIVGEYLERVLETELDEDSSAVARDLFVALVTAAHTRAWRSDAELQAMTGHRHGTQRVTQVLETLRARGLLVRVLPPGGQPTWELVHDSLVPRVLAWIDRRELGRRLTLEMLRHHLRRSSPGAPSVLSRAELRELRAYPDVEVEIAREWMRRPEQAWTPARLVARSRQLARQRTAFAIGVVALVASVSGAEWYRRAREREVQQREQFLRKRDMGRFALELSAFDWDERDLRARPVSPAELTGLTWTLHQPAADDPDSPGARIAWPGRSQPGRVEHVEARGGRAFLLVDGRGRPGERCPPAVVPLRDLPGYTRRERDEPLLRVRVPSCRASAAGMVRVPAGPYLRGGPGDPVSHWRIDELPDEDVVSLPAYWVDRTEVTNAAYASFAAMGDLTGMPMPSYMNTYAQRGAGAPDYPVADLTWVEARAYCRFLGKQLPSSEQWEKAMRGGLVLPDGMPNPMPARNLPWGAPVTMVPTNVKGWGSGRPAAVGFYARDRSPLGVQDLAGNLQEWTDSVAVESSASRIARGGNWDESNVFNLVDFMVTENPRFSGTRLYVIGMRCALAE